MATEGFITPEGPANPNTLGKQEVPVAPISSWALGTVSSVLAFPTALDQSRLEAAFARAASFWPTVVGRYVKASDSGAEFAISLTNSPIPFSTLTVDAEYPYPTKDVIQPDLGQFLPPLAQDYFVPGADAALLAVRLTTLGNGNSVLGVNWAHILGDAAAFSRFLEDVSLFYNMPYADLGEDMPTFVPHVRLPAYTPEIGRDFHLSILEPLPLEDMAKRFADSIAQSQPFTIHLTPDEVAHIVAARRPNERLSDNDLITGWWVSVLERAGQSVDYLVQTINYRTFHKGHPAFPRNLPTLGANVAQMRKIDLPPRGSSGTRAAAVARAVRTEMNHLRADPEATLKWLANAAHEVSAAAREGKGALLVTPPGGVIVNSNLRYDWAIKFGQPSANYHTDISLLRFLRVFQGNPRDDGAERDVELVFRVEWGPAAEAVQRVIDEDRAKWAKEPLPSGEDDEAQNQEPEIKSFSFGQHVHQPAYGGNGN